MYKLLPIVHILAKLGVLFAALLMLPALISWIFGDGLAMYLASISMVTMFIAFVVWVLTAKYQRELNRCGTFLLFCKSCVHGCVYPDNRQ